MHSVCPLPLLPSVAQLLLSLHWFCFYVFYTVHVCQLLLFVFISFTRAATPSSGCGMHACMHHMLSSPARRYSTLLHLINTWPKLPANSSLMYSSVFSNCKFMYESTAMSKPAMGVRRIERGRQTIRTGYVLRNFDQTRSHKIGGNHTGRIHPTYLYTPYPILASQ